MNAYPCAKSAGGRKLGNRWLPSDLAALTFGFLSLGGGSHFVSFDACAHAVYRTLVDQDSPAFTSLIVGKGVG